MTAPPVDRRTAMREAAVDFILAHGLGDLSLHRLADELGTSVGMLLHWFGTRETLVAEVLAAIRERQRANLRTWVRTGGPRTLADALRHHWRWLSAEEQEPYLRLAFEIHGLALQNPAHYPEFGEHAITDWLESVEELRVLTGERGDGNDPDPTFIVATTRGLLLDLLSTGDRARVDAAFERLAEWVEREPR